MDPDIMPNDSWRLPGVPADDAAAAEAGMGIGLDTVEAAGCTVPPGCIVLPNCTVPP